MDYLSTLQRWLELSRAIKALQDEERALREGLFKGTFPQPKEGVNSFTLPDGRILKGTYKLNRVVDQEAILLLPAKLRKTVFKETYSLKTAAYRELDEESRLTVDATLTVTPGLPALEVVTP